MFKKASGLVLIVSLFIAAPASAQSLSNSALKVDFGAPAMKAAPSASLNFLDEAPAARRGATTSWRPLILAGLGFHGGGGIAVGGGVFGTNFLSNEKFGLQIDGLYSTVGGCGFDACNASSLAIGATFEYMFSEMSSGWTPFVGAGLVWSRISFSYDDDLFGCGDIFDCDASASGVDFQFNVGLDKGKIGFEFRGGGWGGGAILFRFRPGAGS